MHIPILLALLLLATPATAQTPTSVGAADRVLTHREQEPLIRERIERRFETVLPELMRREGIVMWIVVSREYNDDPVFRSMAPLTTYSSRRRTILVFHDPGPSQPLERLSVGRFDYNGLFDVVPTTDTTQWEGLRQVVEARDPSVIGINTSEYWSHADGLTATEKDQLVRAMGPDYASRLRSAEGLAVSWLEVKLPEETDLYRHTMRVAHQIIAEAFSNRVIVPGVTTTADVVWWMRQRVAELGLGGWFQPSVRIQRRGGLPEALPGEHVIRRGDMLHTDFGIMYLGYATDTQHNAYVLRAGESEAPAGLVAGLRAANRLQELTMEYARPGATGNEALALALAQARAEGLTPSIYCHPIGYHGHAAGPLIGMSDYQQGVPVRGDYVFRPDTWHSIELNVQQSVPEWGDQSVRFALEEDAALLPDGWDWVDGRQTEFYLIH